MMKLTGLLIAAFAAMSAGAGVAAVSAAPKDGGFTLENEYVALEIASKGGKIVRFYDKTAKRELLDTDRSTYAGLGKSREMLGGALGPLAGRYQLSCVENTPEHAVVKALYAIRGGNSDDMEIERTYTLDARSAVIDIREIWRSKTRPNRFAANWHNQFPHDTGALPEITVFSGAIGFTLAQAQRNKNNYILNPAVSWLASLDRRNGMGVMLQLDKPASTAGYYVWTDGAKHTLEVNFRDAALQPIAAADEWAVSGSLAPFLGRGRVIAVTSEAVLSVDRADGKRMAMVYFLRTLGAGTVRVGNAGKPCEIVAGRKLEIPLENGAVKLVFAAPAREFAFDIAPDAETVPLAAPETQAPVRTDAAGINGFYYFYPELYLSDEIATEVLFGLNGDFRKVKNFRLALALPPGVEIAWCRFPVNAVGKVDINGKSYRKFEIPSFRTQTYSGAMPVDFRITPEFQDGAALYVMAVWDGGAQNPEKTVLHKVAPLPKLNGLKTLRIGLGDNSYPENWSVGNYAKIGVNFVEFWEYLPAVMLGTHLGDGAYAARIADAKSKGLNAMLELGTPFPRPGDVAAGKMLADVGTLHHPERSVKPVDPAELRAVDWRGKSVNMICPGGRGRYYEKCLDNVKTAIDYGFDDLIYDEETWGNGVAICFCERCRNGFRKFLAEKYPQIPYQDPAVTVEHPGRFPELENAWWDYKTDLVAEPYRDIRKTLDAYRNPDGKKRRIFVWLDAGIQPSGRYGAITSRLTDYRKIGRFADAVAPMLYTDDNEAVGTLAATGSELLKDCRAKLIVGLCPNRYYEYFRVESGSFAGLDAVRNQTLEAIFGGARGVIFWSHRGGFRGAHDFRELAVAVKMLEPVEEILVKGKQVKLTASNPDVKVTAWKFGNQYAVLLRNYGTGKVRTRLAIPDGLKAIDTLTGQPAPAELVFDADRAIVLKLR